MGFNSGVCAQSLFIFNFEMTDGVDYKTVNTDIINLPCRPYMNIYKVGLLCNNVPHVPKVTMKLILRYRTIKYVGGFNKPSLPGVCCVLLRVVYCGLVT
jgi:hypothetical protein